MGMTYSHNGGITRREAIGAVAAAALVARCGRTPVARKFPSSRVSIVRSASYSMDVYDTVYRMIGEHGLDVRGKRVVLKPNLVEYDKNTVINTHPVVVHAVYEAFLKMGAGSVTIAEGPGHRRGTLDLADAAGYFGILPRFEDRFVDLNTDAVVKKAIPSPVSTLKSLYLPQTVVDCDLLVSVAKMKTHHWAGATLAMKNLFGVVPGAVYGWPKNVLHWAGINESIVDLHHLFPKQFAIVDGIVGMDGNGPIQGTPKAAGVLVAGRDPVAVDSTCCRVMGIDPRKIGYLELAGAREYSQIGERVEDVRTEFGLVEEWRGVRG